MAEKKIRVHNLAKELEVDSKAIIAKCHAEGIELKNHMDVVSAGLAATVREWFSEGAHSTTLEESGRVDLQTIRSKTRRTKKAAEGEADSPGEPTSVAVMEAPASDEPASKKTTRKTPSKKPTTGAADEPAVEPSEAATSEMIAPPPTWTEAKAPAIPHAEAPSAAHVVEIPTPTEAPPAEVPVAKAPAVPVAKSPTAAPAPPPPPAKHAVAGPQNIPKPAQLSGPKVVRIDKAEPIEPPRPTRQYYRPYPATPTPATPAKRETPAEEDERRRRGHAAPPRRGGRDAAADATEAARVHPRRSIRDTREESTEKLREWRNRDLVERADRLAHASGRGIGGLKAIEGKQGTKRAGTRAAPVHAKKDKIELTEPILVKDFSRATGIPVSDIVKRLMEGQEGELATINSPLQADTAQLLAAEQGIELAVIAAKTGMEKIKDEHDAIERKHLESRPPVVTVLGHVDHGKTSLLDRIRQAKVAAGEAGGITQHIGAYRVQVGKKWVTFLDTPGHTAFTAMRARGTNMTDVVVLVVAADDGVMPTTVEAINHARAANTPIVVALNKIDLPHDINKIYGQLAGQGLTPSGEWGGETDVIKTSATTGQGIDDLLNHLATLSEVMDLKADATIPAAGTVIEAERSESLGNVARVLVQEGTLKSGDIVVCGTAHGRVRNLRDERGRSVKKAGPSTPVEVTGLSDVPMAGDRVFAVGNAQRAKEIAEEMTALRRERELVRLSKPTTLEALLAAPEEGIIPELRVILRADVQGSVDVLKKSLSEFPSDQVKLFVLHAGVGTVNESDVVLAQASEAIIVAFHVVPDAAIARMADGLGVDIRTYRVIYDLLDDIRKALEGLLTPDEKIESRGRAEVRDVFNITKVGRIAGCIVRDGEIKRSHKVRLVRDGVVVKDLANISSLRRFKDDVREVKSGLECGIRIENFDDVKPGDVIEAMEVVKVARKLE